ncbi:MAG: hypothetical protein ACI82I_000259 [Gammaproteobacteria bacterium]|jgi:hypothetical protein
MSRSVMNTATVIFNARAPAIFHNRKAYGFAKANYVAIEGDLIPWFGSFDTLCTLYLNPFYQTVRKASSASKVTT